MPVNASTRRGKIIGEESSSKRGGKNFLPFLSHTRGKKNFRGAEKGGKELYRKIHRPFSVHPPRESSFFPQFGTIKGKVLSPPFRRRHRFAAPCHSDDGDLTAQCESAGANCCNGTNACFDFMGVVCENGCRGTSACRGVAGSVSSDACVGPYACQNFRGAVSQESCVGEYVCYNCQHFKKIGKGSCRGMLNCAGGIPPELSPEEREVADERLRFFEEKKAERAANASAAVKTSANARSLSGEL